MSLEPPKTDDREDASGFPFAGPSVLGFLAVVTLLLGWPAFLYPMYIDQGVFAVCAERMIHGHALYSEAWDVKTPGIFFMYALPLLGGDFQMPLIALFHLILSWISALAVFCLGYRIAGRGYAWTAALLYLVFTSSWGESTSNGQPDNWLVPFYLWSILLITEYWGASRRCLLFTVLAGIMMGWVVLLRPTMGPVAVVLPLLWIIVGFHREKLSFGWVAGLFSAYVSGGFLITALVILELYVTEGLDSFLFTLFDWNMTYAQTSMDWSDPSLSTVSGTFIFMWRLFFGDFWDVTLAIPIGAAALIARRFTGLGYSIRWLLIWFFGLAGGIFSVLVQLKFYNYHFWPALPFVIMAWAFGVWTVIELLLRLYQRGDERRLFKWLAIAGFLLLGVIPSVTPTTVFKLFDRQENALEYLLGMETHDEYIERLGFFELFRPVEDRQATDFILENTPPGQTPRLYIWGFRPEIYFYCGTIGPSRFPYNIPLKANWTPDAWHQELATEVDPSELDFIIIGRDDAFPWLTGNSLESTEYVPEFLSRAIQEEFFLALRTETLKVFARKELFSDWEDLQIEYDANWQTTPPSEE